MAAGIATGYGLDGPGSIPGAARFFLFFTASRPALGPAEPPIQCIPGALSLGVKQQEREGDYSAPSNAEVKNGGTIPPVSHASSCYNV
jgi:hypothetical protein